MPHAPGDPLQPPRRRSWWNASATCAWTPMAPVGRWWPQLMSWDPAEHGGSGAGAKLWWKWWLGEIGEKLATVSYCWWLLRLFIMNTIIYNEQTAIMFVITIVFLYKKNVDWLLSSIMTHSCKAINSNNHHCDNQNGHLGDDKWLYQLPSKITDNQPPMAIN